MFHGKKATALILLLLLRFNMNEKIISLWNQAQSLTVKDVSSRKTQENFITVFSKLIVDKCAEICLDTAEKQFNPLFNRESDGARVCYNKIKDHFDLDKVSTISRLDHDD